MQLYAENICLTGPMQHTEDSQLEADFKVYHRVKCTKYETCAYFVFSWEQYNSAIE